VAILLVTAQDRDCPDPAAQWTAGTVASVHPDGHEFGRKEKPEVGLFVHVVVKDRTPEQCAKYLEEVRAAPTLKMQRPSNHAAPMMGPEPEFLNSEKELAIAYGQKIKRRRRYCIDAQGMERIHAAGGRLVVTYGELARMTIDHGPT